MVGTNPWRRGWLPTPVCLPGKFHGQRSLASYIHRVAKSQKRLKQCGTAHKLLLLTTRPPTPTRTTRTLGRGQQEPRASGPSQVRRRQQVLDKRSLTMRQLYGTVTFDLKVRQEHSSFSLTHVRRLLPGLLYLRTNSWRPCLSPGPSPAVAICDSRSPQRDDPSSVGDRHFRWEVQGCVLHPLLPLPLPPGLAGAWGAWPWGASQRRPSRLDEGQAHLRGVVSTAGGACEGSWYCCIHVLLEKWGVPSVSSYAARLTAPVGVSGCPGPCLPEPELAVPPQHEPGPVRLIPAEGVAVQPFPAPPVLSASAPSPLSTQVHSPSSCAFRPPSPESVFSLTTLGLASEGAVLPPSAFCLSPDPAMPSEPIHFSTLQPHLIFSKPTSPPKPVPTLWSSQNRNSTF